MSDHFLRAIVPEWDKLTEEEKANYRGQLDNLMDNELNPIKRAPGSAGAVQEWMKKLLCFILLG